MDLEVWKKIDKALLLDFIAALTCRYEMNVGSYSQAGLMLSDLDS